MGPRRVTCKQGRELSLRSAVPADEAALRAMYDAFEPKAVAQGLPPADDAQRAEWVAMLLTEPVNVVADHDGELVGHACMLDMDPGERGELEIMVRQDWRNLGVGCSLLTALCDSAREAGYRRIWLSVDARNSRAIRVYRKCGFEQIGPMDLEIDMELTL